MLNAVTVADKQAVLVSVTADPVVVDTERQQVEAVADGGQRNEELHPCDGVGEPRNDHSEQLEEVLAACERRVASLTSGLVAECLRVTRHLDGLFLSLGSQSRVVKVGHGVGDGGYNFFSHKILEFV